MKISLMMMMMMIRFYSILNTLLYIIVDIVLNINVFVLGKYIRQ